jgi:hypothetical protein
LYMRASCVARCAASSSGAGNEPLQHMDAFGLSVYRFLRRHGETPKFLRRCITIHPAKANIKHATFAVDAYNRLDRIDDAMEAVRWYQLPTRARLSVDRRRQRFALWRRRFVLKGLSAISDVLMLLLLSLLICGVYQVLFMLRVASKQAELNYYVYLEPTLNAIQDLTDPSVAELAKQEKKEGS